MSAATTSITAGAGALRSNCPRVVFLSLASDFGCQIALSNFTELLELVGTIELSYWQLVTAGDMPSCYDIAVIEGAVTRDEHVDLLKQVRGIARCVIAVGACAVTAGVPGMANLAPLADEARAVYGDAGAAILDGCTEPRPVDSVIAVDYRVPGCPMDAPEFSALLQRALLGLKDRPWREPLCSSCKVIENECYYLRQPRAGEETPLCLGLVTRSGCEAFCIARDRACTGCRGIADDANLPAARNYIARIGRSVEEFDQALQVYNAAVLDQEVKESK